MAIQLKAIECDPECGFMIKSHDEKEVVTVAKTHAKNKHNLEATDDDMKKRMKVV